ncbi:MAG: type II toxin-antitoxin system VapC family toxin [Bacteroidia bacterium]
MQQVFVDTDVLIDFLTDREPHSTHAAQLFALAEKRELNIYVTSLTFSNTYYVLRRLASHQKVIDKLRELSLLVKVIEVDKKAVELALVSSFTDFEDALQYYSAIQQGKLQVIITRNVKDYKHADFPVMTPESYLKTL